MIFVANDKDEIRVEKNKPGTVDIQIFSDNEILASLEVGKHRIPELIAILTLAWQKS